MRILAGITIVFLLPGCATLNESMSLGATLGSVAGAGATYAGGATQGHSPSLGSVAMGAGVGAVVGIITSYFTHKEVVETRQSCETDSTDMRFGDLPPSPFIVPKAPNKKGNR